MPGLPATHLVEIVTHAIVQETTDDRYKAICGTTVNVPFVTGLSAIRGGVITCPECLRVIVEETLKQMRKLGINVSPEKEHHCAASVLLKIQLDELRQEVERISGVPRRLPRAQPPALRAGSTRSVTPPPDPEPVAAPDDSQDRDGWEKRIGVLEIDE